MPIRPGSFSYGSFVKTASLPMTTPWELAPISAPQIQKGLARSTAYVRSGPAGS